jgi:mannose-6-phosphate isomerase-like protein (cupin superfamily)
MKRELFVNAEEMELVVHKTHGRHSTLVVTEEDMGAQGFIVGCHTMDPGGHSPQHIHENAQEAMFFYQGVGVATIDGVEYEIRPESVMLAPPQVTHSIRNTGDGPLKFVFVYCPPLPEHVSRAEYFKEARDKL